jgi:hypothetical protein
MQLTLVPALFISSHWTVSPVIEYDATLVIPLFVAAVGASMRPFCSKILLELERVNNPVSNELSLKLSTRVEINAIT